MEATNRRRRNQLTWLSNSRRKCRAALGTQSAATLWDLPREGKTYIGPVSPFLTQCPLYVARCPPDIDLSLG